MKTKKAEGTEVGISVVELVIAILVLGILIGLFVAIFYGIRGVSEEEKARATLDNIVDSMKNLQDKGYGVNKLIIKNPADWYLSYISAGSDSAECRNAKDYFPGKGCICIFSSVDIDENGCKNPTDCKGFCRKADYPAYTFSYNALAGAIMAIVNPPQDLYIIFRRNTFLTSWSLRDYNPSSIINPLEFTKDTYSLLDEKLIDKNIIYIKVLFPDIDSIYYPLIFESLRDSYNSNPSINKIVPVAILSARYKDGGFKEFLQKELDYSKNRADKIGEYCGGDSKSDDISLLLKENFNCIMKVLSKPKTLFDSKNLIDKSNNYDNDATAILKWYVGDEEISKELWFNFELIRRASWLNMIVDANLEALWKIPNRIGIRIVSGPVTLKEKDIRSAANKKNSFLFPEGDIRRNFVIAGTDSNIVNNAVISALNRWHG